MADLRGKIAVVTGGARGIGKACCARFLEDGVEALVMIGQHQSTLDAAVAELGDSRVIAMQCDVGSAEQVEETFRKIYARLGRVDILVNNAGVTRDAMFHKMTPEQWQTVININLNGLFYCCKQVIPHMREQNYGKIVNLSSTSAYGNVGQCNYSATKAAIQGFTRTLAKESGRKNITVNAVLPCCIETDMIKTIPPEQLEATVRGIPMQRLGKASELAAVVSFLAGDDSSFMTGQSLIVDGSALTL